MVISRSLVAAAALTGALGISGMARAERPGERRRRDEAARYDHVCPP